MKGRIEKLGAGPQGVRTPGDVLDLPEDEAKALIADNAFTPLEELEEAEEAPKDDEKPKETDSGEEKTERTRKGGGKAK